MSEKKVLYVSLVDSFEKWYANQLHYKKADGTPPGKNWTGITFSVREVAGLLGVSDSSIYELIKKKAFRTAKVGQITNPHFKWGFEKRPQGFCYCSPERRVSQAYTTCRR